MNSSVFPDINVWLALSYEAHIHHTVARDWFNAVQIPNRVYFCRFTQLGLLRLLTNPVVMERDRVCSEAQAWSVHDQLAGDERVAFFQEPEAIEAGLRKLTRGARPGAREWGDSYLAAFAGASGLRLVTFDRALARRTPGTLLLRGGVIN